MRISKEDLKRIIKEELLKEGLDDPFWRKDPDAAALLQKGGKALRVILRKAAPKDLKALEDYLYAPMGASIKEMDDLHHPVGRLPVKDMRLEAADAINELWQQFNVQAALD